MWEKSRFLNVVGSQDVSTSTTIPTWANSISNDVGFQTVPFSANRFIEVEMGRIMYMSLGNNNCGITYPSEYSFANKQNYQNEVNYQNINQWVQLETNCLGDENIHFYNWSGNIYVKVIKGLKYSNAYIMLELGYFHSGDYYETIEELRAAYVAEYPGSQEPSYPDSWVFNPIVTALNGEIQTVAELNSYLEPEVEPLGITYLENSIMPDLSGLQSTLANELVLKGADLTEANTTITSLLSNYYDAVDYAMDELNTKQDDLESAFGLCEQGGGEGGACNDIPQLESEVAALRTNIDELESVETIKNAIDVALDTIADGGTVSEEGLGGLGGASSDINAIQLDIADKTAIISSLNSQVDANNSQIASLEDAIESTGNDVSTLVADFQSLNSDIDSKEIAIQNLLTQLENLNISGNEDAAELIEKQQQITTLTNNLTQANSDLTDMTNEREQLAAEVITLTSTNSGLTSELELSVTTISDLETNKTNLEGQIEVLIAQGVTDESQITDLISNISTLDTEIAAELLIKESLEAELIAEQNITSNQQTYIGSLLNDASILATEKENLGVEIQELNIAAVQLNIELEESKNALDEAIAAGVLDDNAIAVLEETNLMIAEQLTTLNAEKVDIQTDLTNTQTELSAMTQLKVQALLDLVDEQLVSSGLEGELTTALEEKANLETNLTLETEAKLAAETSLSNANADLMAVETFLEESTTTTTNLTTELGAEADALVAALDRFGYPQPENFSGFSGNDLVDAVRRAGNARRGFLNFRGQVIENDARKQKIGNTKLKFSTKAKPRKQVTFRADGGEDFSTKYGTLGKLGLLGGLIYLITKK